MTVLRDLSIPSGYRLPGAISFWGDSTTYGLGVSTTSDTSRSVLSRAFTPDRLILNMGINGEAPTAIADRFLARPDSVRDATQILYFGRISYGLPYTVFTEQCDRVWADRDHDRIAFLVPGPGADVNEMTPGSSQITANNDARAEFIAAYPDNYIDHMQDMWDAVLPGDALVDRDAETVGYCPPKFLSDDIHRNAAGQLIEATSIFNFITLKGW